MEDRSSPPDVFLRKDALEICSKFTGEQPCRSMISFIYLFIIYLFITFFRVDKIK